MPFTPNTPPETWLHLTKLLSIQPDNKNNLEIKSDNNVILTFRNCSGIHKNVPV